MGQSAAGGATGTPGTGGARAVLDAGEAGGEAGHGTPSAELRLPADGAYLAVLRTATAGLAARINFTLDDIEDLRIAVDEACAMLLPQARPGSALACRFWLGAATMTVAVSATCDAPEPPAEQGFAWRVLSALTTSARAEVHGDQLVLTLARSAGRHP